MWPAIAEPNRGSTTKMAAAHLVCLTADGGVPLFYRNTGQLKPLPFPVIGSLNGVHMFGKNHDVSLQSTVTEDSKIVWKSYHNSLTLVLVTRTDNASDRHLTSVLDTAFNAMVLVYGFEDLTNIKNVDRFKREIKITFRLLDALLSSPTQTTLEFTALTRCVEVIAGPENNVLQSYITAFAEAAESPYGCLLVSGRVAVATDRWWALSATERVLLALLLASSPRVGARDVAVFLPDNSPAIPHRLLTFELLPSVEACVICGPTPALADLQQEVSRYWRPSIDSLRSLSRLVPRNFPVAVALDNNVMGFLLVNSSTNRCLCSVHPQTDVANHSRTQAKLLSSVERREALQSFYKSVMGGVWSATTETRDKHSKEESCDASDRYSHAVTDTYTVTDRHKCYTLRSAHMTLLVLYTVAMPTYAMRSVTQKTLDLLLRDKHVIV